MRLLLIAGLFAASLSACSLRPRYADFVTASTTGKEATFVVTDAATHQPVPGAKVEVSEGKNRIIVTTALDGTFTLPVDKKYIDDNPVMVVILFKGFEVYQVSLAGPVAPPAAPMMDAPPAGPPPPAAPPLDGPDAGMPASNG